VSDCLKNYTKEVFGIYHYYARFEFTKNRGHIYVHILAMLGKKSSIIELNDLVYKERHDMEKQALVTDDWMMNAKLPQPKLRKPTDAQTFQCARLPHPKLSQSTDVQRSQRTLRATQVICALVRAYVELLENRLLRRLL
jgi:hypothetical protein